MSKLKILVTGGHSKAAEVVRCVKTVAKELQKRLSTLSEKTPTLLHAQVGSGKTHAIVHMLLPWAIANSKKILYISSRVANNTQVKQDLIEVTGESRLLKELTPEGLQRHQEFKNIDVVTYHALYSMMIYAPQDLKKYDIVVFDEIHALLEDALFVPYTGYVLSNFKKHFGDKIRLYLSATPEEILPLLVEAETPYQLTVLKFPRDFSYVKPRFFRADTELIDCINNDSSNKKWLVFTSSIKHGEKLASQLKCSVCMLNSESRSQDNELWDTMLSKKSFDAKVAIATAVVDVGVSFEDSDLKNVAVFTTSLTTVIQFLGRKRRKGSEKVNLYVWCPDKKMLFDRIQGNRQLLTMLDLFKSNPMRFMEHHAIHPNKHDLRRFIRVGWNAEMYLNHLACVKLKNEISFCSQLLEMEKRTNTGFDRKVVSYLRLKDMEYNACWLLKNKQEEFEAFLEGSVGHKMSENEFWEFSNKFRDLCVDAYGTGEKGRDRKDRHWNDVKIPRKLEELGGNYRLLIDSKTGTYTLTFGKCVDDHVKEEHQYD